jgi:hypothetical protein
VSWSSWEGGRSWHRGQCQEVHRNDVDDTLYGGQGSQVDGSAQRDGSPNENIRGVFLVDLE